MSEEINIGIEIPSGLYEIIKGNHKISKNVGVTIFSNKFVKINQDAINCYLTIFLTPYELKTIYELVFGVKNE